MPVGSCRWQTWKQQRAENWFQKKYKADFGWVPQGCLFTEKPHNRYAKYLPMHSATQQKTLEQSLHTCICLKISRLLFFPWRNLAGGGHFYELFSILSWLHRTCNESVYEQLHKSNLRKWNLLIEMKRVFGKSQLRAHYMKWIIHRIKAEQQVTKHFVVFNP